MGYLKPTADPEGFLLPVFRAEGANGLCVQTIGPDGAVSGFSQIFPKGLREAPDHERCAVSQGEPAIWAFADQDGIPSFRSRAALQAQLRPRLAHGRDPFLQLQIARFCDAETELAVAWRAAFGRLEKHSPRSALAWRDMVVLPAAIRSAVAEIAAERGVEQAGDYWDHAVETQMRNDRLTILLSPLLFRLFTDSFSAHDQLHKRSVSVRKAFSIKTDRLNLEAMGTGDPGQPSGPVDPASARIVVALGSMAENLVRASSRQTGFLAVPLCVRQDDRLQNVDPLLILRGEEVIEEKSLRDDFPSSLIGEPGEMLIVFQLGPSHFHLLEAACRIAERYRHGGAHVTAVIPHLPDMLFDPGEPGGELPNKLLSGFDGIWFLSDRSANVRHPLPFGPARSHSVASRHFRFMCERAHDWMRMHPSRNGKPSVAEVILVGSAEGNRMTPSLLDHAIMRLLHPEIDLASAKEVMIMTQGAPEQHQEIVRIFGDREFPQAGILSIPNGRGTTAYGEVVIAARDVAMHPATPLHFEEMCAGQFAKAGWNVVNGGSGGVDLTVRLDDARLLVECGFDLDEGGSGNYRARVGKRWRDEVVLITTRSVRRKQFLRHVLNGQTTIHYSRISALQLIHRRRFTHVITALKKGQLDVEREVIPACLNWLAMQPDIVDLLSAPARVELSDHDKIDHGLGPDRYMFRLPVLIKPQRSGERIMPASATVQVVLNWSGWRLISVVPQ